MYKIIVATFCVFLLTACSTQSNTKTKTEPETNKSTIKEVSKYCPTSDYSKWNECEGKEVKLEGHKPKMIMQHPMVGGFSLEGEPPIQGYMDINDGTQIVLLTKTRITCEGEMTAIGKLVGIDLGGPKGTKQSYSGWYLDNAKVTCKK